MVDGVRQIEQAIGVETKTLLQPEQDCRQKLGKSVVSRVKLSAGTRLRREHLDVKVGQPLGWQPQHIDQLVDQILTKDIDKDETFPLDCIASTIR